MAILREPAKPLGHRVYPSSLTYRCFVDEPDRMRRPDVSVIRVERLRKLPDPNPGVMPIAPDLAVEVVSTHDKAQRVDAKIQEYLNASVPRIWVLWPETRTIHAYEEDSLRRLSAGDMIDAGDLLPGWSVRVAKLFGD